MLNKQIIAGRIAPHELGHVARKSNTTDNGILSRQELRRVVREMLG